MNKTYSSIWIHLLFSTKNCQPLIDPSIKNEVYAHMHAQLTEMDCVPRIITGMPDHVHILFRSNPVLRLSDIVKQLKGNTSHWINDKDLARFKFVWEKGFSAFSESGNTSDKTMELLNNQEKYHSEKSYIQEVDELISFGHSVEGNYDSRRKMLKKRDVGGISTGLDQQNQTI